MASIAERRAALAQSTTNPAIARRREALAAERASQGRSNATALPDRRETPAEPFDFSVLEMLENIPESGLEAAKATVAPLLSPVETARSLRDLARGMLSKAAGLDDPSEKTVNAMVDFYKERYGSIDKAKRSLQDDPVGVILDASAIFTAGGSAAARAPGQVGKVGKAVAAAGQALDVPANMLAQGAGKAGQVLSDVAAPRVMASAAKLPPSLRKKRKKIIRAMLDEGISPTPRGVVKLERIVEGINEQLDGLIAAADDRLGMVPTRPVFDALDDLIRRSDDIFGVEAVDDVKKLKKFRDKLAQSLTDSNGEVQSFISVGKAQKSKQAAWKKANFASRKGKFAKNEANKTVGSALRQGIEDTVTEGPVADLNARQAPLLEMRDALESSIGAQENRNILGSMSALGAGGGVGIATQDPTSAFAAAMAAQTLGRGDVKGAIARGINQGGNAFSNAAAALYTPEGLAALQLSRELEEARNSR